MSPEIGASGVIGRQLPDSALLEYHRRSKHRLDRYAPGPGRLDWANQPDPFRRYAGAAAIKMPLAADAVPTRYATLRCGDVPPMQAFDVRSVAVMFELSLGLSAWKSFGGNQWALRCNPSSGNLHPTEGYQPDPFRRYAGAAAIKLPLAADALPTRYAALRRGELPAMQPFDIRSVAVLFELSLGLSAWKSFGGNRWALRCNPSSGNLHPTEGYLLCPNLPGLSAGVYHYVSRDHTLERRAALDHPRWSDAFENGGVVLGLSSIYWREAWKYGMRAWRYCQHDCGHAIAALCYAAAALGWQTRLLASAGDELVSALLGLDREADFGLAEPEAPDALLWVGPGGSRPQLERMREELRNATWSGRANCLSAQHVPWHDIDSIHRATRKPATSEPAAYFPPSLPPTTGPVLDATFATIARQRRSAVDFDGETHISERIVFRDA